MPLSLKDLYRAWRYRVKLDPQEIKFLRSSIRSGDTVVDIGAHKGAYTYWMQRSCGREGACYAFEPQPALFENLNATYQKHAHVHVLPLALSDREGIHELFVPDATSIEDASPGATLESQRGTGLSHAITTNTIDAFFSDKAPPSFIKIDVEGHELATLRGGQKVLSKEMPRLLIECERRHLQHEIWDVFMYLEQLGYQGHFYLHGHLRSLHDFNLDMHQPTGEGRFWTASGYVNNFMFEPG